MAHHGGFNISCQGLSCPTPFAVGHTSIRINISGLVKKYLRHGAQMISRYNAALFIKNQLKRINFFIWNGRSVAQIRSKTYWKEFWDFILFLQFRKYRKRTRFACCFCNEDKEDTIVLKLK